MSYHEHSRPDETWKPLSAAPTKYSISSHGRVWSNLSGRMLKPVVNAHGYPVVDVGGRVISVHVLVCETFHGPRPLGAHAAHSDGVKTNCRSDNLRWASPHENAADKVAHGTAPRGERHPSAILTDEKVLWLRRRWREGASWAFLAAELGVSASAARAAGTGRTYPHLPERCPSRGEPGWRSGGEVRAATLSAERRSEISRAGARACHAVRYSGSAAEQ